MGTHRFILTRTYRAFLGTPPASGSGSPRRTWPLRKPAAPEAATWAASWLWVAPSNHPERDLVSPCSEEETLETYTQAGDYKAAECLCMALSPSLCVWGYLPPFKSFSYRKCDVVMLDLAISVSSSKKRVLKAIVPPWCGSSVISLCCLRPPCSAVLSHPVCTAHHRTAGRLYYCHPDHWMYRQSTTQPKLSIRPQQVDNHCLFTLDWTIFTNATKIGQQESQFLLNHGSGRGEEELISRVLNMPKRNTCKIVSNHYFLPTFENKN